MVTTRPSLVEWRYAVVVVMIAIAGCAHEPRRSGLGVSAPNPNGCYVFFAAYVRDYRPGPVLLTAALLVTLVTQEPFVQMDMTQYFRDWFPGYVYRTDDATPEFWSTWQLRIALTVGAAIALGIVQWRLLGRSFRSATFVL
jgi:hypothetical protein